MFWIFVRIASLTNIQNILRIKQGLSYTSFYSLRILYNSKFILMATSLGTKAVDVTRVHCRVREITGFSIWNQFFVKWIKFDIKRTSKIQSIIAISKWKKKWPLLPYFQWNMVPLLAFWSSFTMKHPVNSTSSVYCVTENKWPDNRRIVRYALTNQINVSITGLLSMRMDNRINKQSSQSYDLNQGDKWQSIHRTCNISSTW